MAHDKFYWGDDPSKEPGQQHLDTAPPTGGDMLKTQYDQDNDGQVDSADHATTAGHATTADVATKMAGVDNPGPGVNHYYGTDAGGLPGFWPIPGATAPTYALDDLTDVTVSAPSNGQVLTFNSLTMQWEAATPPGAGGGEANTASNLGGGEGLFANKVGVDLQFKSLVASGPVSLTSDGTTVTIGSSAEANTASNKGAGEGLFIQKTGADLEFKSLVAGSNVSVTSDANEVFVEVAELTEYSETTATAASGTILRADGGIQGYTMTANTAFTFDLTEGQSLTLHLNGGDTHTATWPTITWVGGAAPTLTAADVLEFWVFGATLFGAYVGDV